MPKETKEARKERQRLELWQFVDVLRRAGNTVTEEVPLPKPDNWPGERMTPWRIDLVVKAERIFGRNQIHMALPLVPVAIEIQGRGLYGRHGNYRQIQSDRDKLNEMVITGYRPLYVTREQIANGDALELLARCSIPVESSGGGGGGKE